MGLILEKQPAKKRDRSGVVSFLVRLPAPFVDELEAAARSAGMSRNKAIAKLLRFALDADAAQDASEAPRKHAKK